jgi:hypothetical protein
MPLETFTLPVIPAIAKATRAKVDHFALGSYAEWIDALSAPKVLNTPMAKQHGHWAGGTMLDVLKGMREGNPALAAESDALLREFEDAFPLPTARNVIVDDVQGAVPNIPAYLAGQPLAMRRRAKREDDTAPVAIMVDLTSSAHIHHRDVAKRGAAILALVRAISARRPVELWVGAGIAASRRREDGSEWELRDVDAIWNFARLDTAPLDLARAAHMLTATCVSRSGFYAYAEAHHGFITAFPYGDNGLSRQLFEPIVRRAFPHMAEFIAVPSIQLGDDSVTNPVKWVKDQVQLCLGVDLDA